MKNLKRVLALFLVLTLCLSLFPISAFAEEGEEEMPAIEEIADSPAEELPAQDSEEPETPEQGEEETPAPCEHVYVPAVTEPTCTEGGYTTYTCALCGDEYVDDYTDALGHTPEDAAEVPSTCTEHGHAAGVVCSVCGAVLSGCEELPLAEHSPTDVAEVPAEPGKPGVTAGVLCAVCGEILEGCEEIEALEEDIPEDLQDVRTRVLFVCEPEDTIITVYACVEVEAGESEDIGSERDPLHGAEASDYQDENWAVEASDNASSETSLAIATDENGEPVVIQPEADGSYLLVPGDYLFDATCEGYVSIKAETLHVLKSCDLETALSSLDATEHGGRQEAQIVQHTLQAVSKSSAPKEASVAINKTNFPNATFRNYVSDNFDTNGNGSLSSSEISNAWYIDVKNKDINSLKGIEKLTDLVFLNCGYNNLSSLDLSKNTKLAGLHCEHNRLSKLDLSGLDKLTVLWCWNNSFKTLDIRPAPLLEKAFLTGTKETYGTFTSFFTNNSDISADNALKLQLTGGSISFGKGPGPFEGVVNEGSGWKLKWKCYLNDSDCVLEISLTTNQTDIDEIVLVNNSPWLESQYGFQKSDFSEIIIRGTEAKQPFIMSEMFKDYTGLKRLTLDHVYGLGFAAFQGCSQLERIDGFDEYLIGIGTRAFKDCVKLKQIVYLLSSFPKSLETIGDEAFMNTRLEGVYLLEEVNSIGKDAFRGCESILTVYCYPNTGAQFYAEDHGIKYNLLNESSRFRMRHDSWQFENFGDNSHYITDSDFARLEEIAGDNVRRSILEHWRSKRSFGSCRGMSAAAVLVKMGLLSPSSFERGANELYDVSESSSVKSLINFYHFAQFLDNSIIEAREFKKLSVAQQLKRIETMAEDGGAPIMLCVGNWASNGLTQGGHAVVAYGVEHRGNPYIKNFHSYNSRILIYDVNYPKNKLINLDPFDSNDNTIFKDTSIYYNRNTDDWYWPAHPEYNDLIMATNNPAVLAPTEPTEALDSFILYSWAGMQSGYGLTIDGREYAVTSAINDGDVIAIPVIDGGSSSDVMITIPSDASEYVITPSDGSFDFTIEMENASMTVGCDSAEEITFHPDGSFTAAEVGGDYDMTLVFNEDFHTTPWYQTAVQGTGSGDFTMQQTEDGIVVDGAGSGAVTVKVTDSAGSEEQLSFLTDTETVLVTAIPIAGQEVPIVMEDKDKDGSFERLLAAGQALSAIMMDQEYLIIKSTDTTQRLTVTGLPVELMPYLEWESDNANVVKVVETEDGKGQLAPVGAGTAWITASVGTGESMLTARCRVDVVAGEVASEVTGVRLLDPKATVELYKTDYTRITVIPELSQNSTLDAAAPTILTPDEDPVLGTGVAVQSARLAEVKPDAKHAKAEEVFLLSVVDDRTLEIIPKAEYITSDATKLKALKGSYKATLFVTVDGREFEAGVLTLTVKKTLPKLTAKALKLNSCYADTQSVIFTGSVPERFGTYTAPDWFCFDKASRTITYTGPLNAKQAAYKLTLPVKVEGWAVEMPVTLSVSAAPAAPKLTVKAVGAIDLGVKGSAVTLVPTLKNYSGQADLSVTKITDAKGTEASGLFGISGLAITAGETVPAGKYKATVMATIPGAAPVSAVVQFAVKAPAKAPEMSVTLKATGFIDVIRPESAVTITPTVKNLQGAVLKETDLTITRSSDGKTGLFDVTVVNGKYVVTAKPGAGVSSLDKYTVKATVAGIGLAKPLALSVKMGTAKVTQSAKSVTLLKTDRNSQATVKLSAADGTLSAIDWARTETAFAAQNAGKAFSFKHLGNGECVIGYKTGSTPKAGTVKIPVFFTGNLSSKPNATLSVSVKLK